MLRIQKESPNLSNAGCANPKARSIGLRLRLMISFTILTFASGCTEFALLASGSSLAISQNTYAKVYNGVDFLTVISTEKGIKQHLYEKGKKHVQTLTRITND